MSLEEYYDHAIAVIRDLEDQIELMHKQIQKFTLDSPDSADEFVNEDFIDPSDMIEFLEDIGFDPFDLPSSVGERRDLYDLIQAARKVR